MDEPSDPIDVSLLSVDAVVVVRPPDDAADLIEQPGLAPCRGRILMSVHAVFPYGGARAPLYNPLRLQGLASLAAAYDIIRRPPARLNALRSRSLVRGTSGTKPVLSP